MILNSFNRFNEYATVNTNATLYCVAQVVPSFSGLFPISIVSPENSNVQWQIGALNDDSKRLVNPLEGSLLIMVNQGTQLAQSRTYDARVSSNLCGYVGVNQDVVTRNQTQQKMTNIIIPKSTEDFQNQMVEIVALPPVPVLDVAFDSRFGYGPVDFGSAHDNKEKRLVGDTKELRVSLKSDFSKSGNNQGNQNDAKKDCHLRKRFVCMYCNKELFNSTGLKHHIYTHTNEWPFRCSWPGCHKGTATRRDLVKHQRIHNGERPFECDLCNKKFTQSGVMNRHKKACVNKQKKAVLK